MSFNFPYRIVYPAPSKIIKINLTKTSDGNASESNWNNFYFDTAMTSLPLIDSTGASSGWAIIATAIYGEETIGSPSIGDSDFPNDVLNTQWYAQDTSHITLVISGLNSGKLYSINIASIDNSSGLTDTGVTINGVSHTITSNSNVLGKYTFTGIAPDGSNDLTIDVVNIPGNSIYAFINAIIITEN